MNWVMDLLCQSQTYVMPAIVSYGKLHIYQLAGNKFINKVLQIVGYMLGCYHLHLTNNTNSTNTKTKSFAAAATSSLSPIFSILLFKVVWLSTRALSIASESFR